MKTKSLCSLATILSNQYREQRGSTGCNQFQIEVDLKPGVKVLLSRDNPGHDPGGIAILESNNGMHINLGTAKQEEIETALKEISKWNKPARYTPAGDPDYQMRRSDGYINLDPTRKEFPEHLTRHLHSTWS